MKISKPWDEEIEQELREYMVANKDQDERTDLSDLARLLCEDEMTCRSRWCRLRGLELIEEAYLTRKDRPSPR